MISLGTPRRLAGGERCTRRLKASPNVHCERVRAAKYAPQDPLNFLERCHGLAKTVERGVGVQVERLGADRAAGAPGVAHTGGADDASRAGACSVGGSSRCSYASGPGPRGGGPARASYLDDGSLPRLLRLGRRGGGGARDYCRLRDGGGAGYVARRGAGASSTGSRAHYVDGPRAGRAVVAGAVAARRRSLKHPLSV